MPISDDALDAAFRASPLFQHLERLGEAGPDPIPDTEAKRHHFIPQFLLRRFLAPGQDQLNVASGKPQAIAPESAASSRRFYSVTDDEGDRHAKVESFLGIVESHAAGALNHFLEEPESLEPGDRATLAYFLGLVGIRTPGAAARTAAATDALSTVMFAGRLIHPDVFAHDYQAAIGDGTQEEIEELRLEMLAALREGRIEVEDPRAYAIGIGLQVSGDLAAVIYPADWRLLRTESSFITSDTGLAMYDPTPRFPWSGNAWFSSPAAETSIPLSRHECLTITPAGDARTEVVEVGEEVVDMMNLRIYGWATDYIYGASQEVVTQVRRLAKQRPGDVLRPRPWHHTILVDLDPLDSSLADDHQRRGWPRHLSHEGVLHDYIVVGVDGSPVEAGSRASLLARQRAPRP